MGKKLAIQGHATRGEEVIKLLKIIGGSNCGVSGSIPHHYYYLNTSTSTYIDAFAFESEFFIRNKNNFMFYTLEEFLEKYPFYNGDKVFDIADVHTGIITGMKWDEDVSDMKYHVAFDNGDMGWYTNDTIELLKKDENLEEVQSAHDKSIFIMEHSMWPIVKDNFLEYDIIDGYEFEKVENGKIILKPIKSKYPTNYQECCDVLGLPMQNTLGYINKECNKHDYYNDLQSTLNCFVSLKICRDAYWKIAGEEMGLGKPWESPLPSLFETVHCIRRQNNKIIKGAYRGGKSEILEFPTEEMRDAFYENFKDLIEQCKELL